ncbi:MAG: hypothetical protein SCM11_01150 [Bacillota bacterium]|nr:hypothetical protein [Bacillota bacterium]
MTRQKTPLIPMGAITGKPTEAALRVAIYEYVQNGFEQFLIYPRSGAEIEYMSEEWLNVCATIVRIASEYDMHIWLYDEFNWPSGSCKGQVVSSDPAFAAQYIAFSRTEAEQSPRIELNEDFPDILSHQAVEKFIELTHEKYYLKLAPFFGATIKGFFTDEPSFYYACRKSDELLRIPYYEDLYEEYHAETGRHFVPDVQYAIKGGKAYDLWTVYARLLGNRMRSAFCDPITNWCKMHQVQMSGHLMSESPVVNAVRYNGNLLHVLNGFTVPGIDEIHTRTSIDQAEWLTFGSVHQVVLNQGQGGLAELFALGPSDMPLATMRQMIWLSAMFGIKYYVLAVAALDARGNALKSNYFNPMNSMQPWSEAFRLLNDDAWDAARFAEKDPEFDLYVRYPQTEAAECYIAAGASPIDRRLNELLIMLVKNQLSWALVDENNEIKDNIKPVINVQADGYMIESDNRLYAQINTLLDKLLMPGLRKVTVTAEPGKLAESVFVRHFQDGSVVVLDLSESDGERVLTLNKPNDTKTFKLPGRGVYTTVNDCLVLPDMKKKLVDPTTTFHLELDRPNLMRFRLTKDNPRVEFTISEPVDALRIIARTFDGVPELMLDERPVRLDLPCTQLVPGFNELYDTSGPILLECGQHVLSMKSDTEDYLYLPVAYLSGRFALSTEHAIRRLPESVGIGSIAQSILAHYAGKINYTTEVFVPVHRGPLHLQVNTYSKYTKVWLDQQLIGERAWEPFIYEVPDHCKGRHVQLKIEMSTSIGPMFGTAGPFDWSGLPAGMVESSIVPGRFHDCGLAEPLQWLITQPS